MTPLGPMADVLAVLLPVVFLLAAAEMSLRWFGAIGSDSARDDLL